MHKVLIFRTAVVYIFLNIVLGIGSVIMTELMLNNEINKANKTTDSINEISLVASVYDMAVSNKSDDFRVWAMCFYCIILLSGLVSMVSRKVFAFINYDLDSYHLIKSF